MAKKHGDFEKMLNGMSLDEIIRMVRNGFGQVPSDAAKYPYVKEHATLQVSSVEPEAYHIYVSLAGSPVKIFRRLTVPSNLRLEHLAEIILRAMGWENYHLHQFIVNGEYFVSPKELEEDDTFHFTVRNDAMACTIGDVLKEKGKQIRFEYDFGDSWMHNVRLSSIGAYDPEHAISVDSGSGECPPEDIGGIYGYAEVIEEDGLDKNDLKDFDLEDAQLSVAAYVAYVKDHEKEYVEPKTGKSANGSGKSNKKGAKTIRMLPYTFTVADIRKLHPRGLKPFQTDQEYALLANRIERAILDEDFPDFKDANYMKSIISRVIMYYEDIIADAGIWRSFVEKNKELYGKPIPFYNVDDDYYPDEPHAEDVRILIWDAMRDVRGKHKVANPENPAIVDAAEIIYGILDSEFENVGINENLAEYFKKADFADNFYEMRDVLKWIFFDCYLTSDGYTEDIMHDARENLKPIFTGQEAAYVAECVVPMKTQVGMLALLPKDWLSLFVSAKGNKAVAQKIAGLEATETNDVLKMTGNNAKSISFVDLQDRKIVIERGYRYNIPEKDFKNGDGAIGAYAKYDGKWYLNGNQSWGFIDKIFDKAKEMAEPTANIDVKGYDRLMKLSGGSPLFYFKNITEYKRFLVGEAGWTKDEMKSLRPFSGAKDLVMFMQGHDKPFAIIANLASAICDPRNPYYNKKKAKDDAFEVVFSGESCPGVIARYLISHKMLPDAALNSLKGAEYGRQQVQNDIDFFARAYRRENY